MQAQHTQEKGERDLERGVWQGFRNQGDSKARSCDATHKTAKSARHAVLFRTHDVSDPDMVKKKKKKKKKELKWGLPCTCLYRSPSHYCLHVWLEEQRSTSAGTQRILVRASHMPAAVDVSHRTVDPRPKNTHPNASFKEVRCSFYEFSKPIRFCSNLIETFFNPFPIRKCKKNWGSPCWFSRWRWSKFPWWHAQFRSGFFY